MRHIKKKLSQKVLLRFSIWLRQVDYASLAISTHSKRWLAQAKPFLALLVNYACDAILAVDQGGGKSALRLGWLFPQTGTIMFQSWSPRLLKAGSFRVLIIKVPSAGLFELFSNSLAPC